MTRCNRSASAASSNSPLGCRLPAKAVRTITVQSHGRKPRYGAIALFQPADVVAPKHNPPNALEAVWRCEPNGALLAPPEPEDDPPTRTWSIMRIRSFRPLPAATIATLLLVVACDDSPTAPGIEPQVINNTDAFSYQTSDLSNVTGSSDYTWQNTGTSAKVTHSSDAGATGTASLTIIDAGGVQVYSGSFATTGETVTSPSGAAGSWTIRVTYASYSNTQVNFAVIKE